MKRRPLELRLAAAEEQLDFWLTRTTIAVNRVRHYRQRINSLRRQLLRPSRTASRAIRLR